MGVSSELIQMLNPNETKDLLKGLLYLNAKYAKEADAPRGI
jgi:hypothetical protein